MKYNLIIMLFFSLVGLQICDKKAINHLSCNEFKLNKPFTAKIADQWCLEGAPLKITFGPMLEDSRCNVENIPCVWAGRYVLAATIDDGEMHRDTFYAVNNWTDTLYHGNYRIILAKVYPEMRTSMEPLDPQAYSFDILVK